MLSDEVTCSVSKKEKDAASSKNVVSQALSDVIFLGNGNRKQLAEARERAELYSLVLRQRRGPSPVDEAAGRDLAVHRSYRLLGEVDDPCY